MPTNPNDQKLADQQLTVLVTCGVFLTLIGGLVAGLAWPHTTIETSVLSGTDAVEHGNRWLALLGGTVFWAGNMLAAVGLIGWGVKYGNQATKREVTT